jgi:Leucine-rich repeat (LRR) protein
LHCCAGDVNTTSLPVIEQLTALEELWLDSCSVESSCLLPMTTGLTSLSLQQIDLQPPEGQHSGASQLLQLLARLTALQEIILINVEGGWPQQQLAQYSALTASRNLQELWVSHCDFEDAVWAHVFPAGRQLPQLRVFRGGGPAAPFDSTAMARLVSCCTALKDLELRTAAGASLTPLQSLSGLTGLSISSVGPAAIRSDLAALTQLQSLDVSVSLPAAAGAGEDKPSWLQHLVPLAALTGLTTLSSHYRWLSSKVRHLRAVHACTPECFAGICAYRYSHVRRQQGLVGPVSGPIVTELSLSL